MSIKPHFSGPPLLTQKQKPKNKIGVVQNLKKKKRCLINFKEQMADRGDERLISGGKGYGYCVYRQIRIRPTPPKEKWSNINTDV